MKNSYNITNTVKFPSQKKSFSQKTEEWKKQCIDSAEFLAIYSESALRKSYYNKVINYDLYSDVLHEEDVRKISDPFELNLDFNPGKIQNYPLINPKIDLLVGEEFKRKFDWRLRIVNDDVLIEKKLLEYDEFKEFIISLANQNLSDEELEQELKKFKKYSNFSKKDFREMYGTYIIKYLEHKEKFDVKFNNGMKDALISAEEIYQWDIVADEPVLIKLNPLNVHTVLNGESNHIEDADIIVIDGYYSPGQIQDYYHDTLTSTEIDLIEEASFNRGVMSGTYAPDMTLSRKDIDQIESVLTRTRNNTSLNFETSAFDNDGNIRVLKVYWKSRRRMKIITSYDKFGQEVKKLMPEFYKPKKELGETSKTLWINEWMEGHKIMLGDTQAIYTRMRVKPVQYRNLMNPSKCYPGIIGTIYTTNNQKAVSFMDKGKPYQYLYNVLMNNIEMLISANWGKILKIPLHEVPDGWKMEKWLAYAKYFKAVPTDAFQEGKKGAAIGKIAGSLQQGSPVINMELGNTIDTYVRMAEYIETKIGQVLGVTRGREGQVSQSELVGNVERQVLQSTYITEYYFMEHDYLKSRVMLAGLETAKIAWKGKKFLDSVLDDFTARLIEVDMDSIKTAQFDMDIESSFKNAKIKNTIENLAQAALQNQMLSFTELIDILKTDSINSAHRKLERLEEERKQEIAQAQQSSQQAALQQQQMEEAKELKKIKLQSDLKKEEILLQKSLEKSLEKEDTDLNDDGVDDRIELEKEKIKGENEMKLLQKKQQFEREENAKDRKLEEKAINSRQKKK